MESQYSELALTDMYFSEQNEYEEDVAEQPLESNKYMIIYHQFICLKCM